MNIILLNNNKDEVAAKAAEIIRSGGVVILPFDTVYGFACDPRNTGALEKIFKIKSRPLSKTIGLAASNMEGVKQVADLTYEMEEFIASKTPGRYTFILKLKEDVDLPEYCQLNNTVGIRVPDSELVLNITKESGGLIAQTSANVSGMPNCFSVEELKDQYGNDLDEVDLIVDGGAVDSEGSSEIWDLTGDHPQVIERSS